MSINKELIEKVKAWGIEKGIDKADALMQTTKIAEETIELQRAILNYNIVNVEEEIGDILVTLIMLGLQLDLEVDFGGHDEDTYNFEHYKLYNCISMFMMFIDYGFIDDMKIESQFNELCASITTYLYYICDNKYQTLTLEKCLQTSYDKISKRSGKMVDGLWTKEKEGKDVN